MPAGVPATVFLPMDFIQKGKWLWHDLINFVINNTHQVRCCFDGKTFDLSNANGKQVLREYLATICKGLTTVKRDQFIAHTIRELNVEVPEHPTSDYAPMRTDQLLEMSKFNISYGAHTCTHPILTQIPAREALLEIMESKARAEDILMDSISAFAYPNGTRNDFNETIKDQVKVSGFECAMSMIYGLNDRNTDRYELRRVPIGGNSFVRFVQDLSGLVAFRNSLRK